MDSYPLWKELQDLQECVELLATPGLSNSTRAQIAAMHCKKVMYIARALRQRRSTLWRFFNGMRRMKKKMPMWVQALVGLIGFISSCITIVLFWFS